MECASIRICCASFSLAGQGGGQVMRSRHRVRFSGRQGQIVSQGWPLCPTLHQQRQQQQHIQRTAWCLSRWVGGFGGLQPVESRQYPDVRPRPRYVSGASPSQVTGAEREYLQVVIYQDSRGGNYLVGWCIPRFRGAPGREYCTWQFVNFHQQTRSLLC
jgi:hypothetical protein